MSATDTVIVPPMLSTDIPSTAEPIIEMKTASIKDDEAIVSTPETTLPASDSEDQSENVPDSVSESGATTTAAYEISEHNKTTNSSSHHDSEYDTASDTPSSGNELNDDDDDDFEDDDDDELGDEEDDDESIDGDLERERGDGEEQDGDKKKVDDDEDRSNPQYIPKRGVFYEHDDRTADEPESSLKGEGEEENPDEKKPEEVGSIPKKPIKKTVDRWSHDRFNASDQAPKSRAELVNSYGYDIRSEEGPPRARRRRRYGSGPNKYTRKWEDESAYNKMSSQQLQRNPRPDDFPELGTRKAQRNNGTIREEKENNVDEALPSEHQRHRSPIQEEKLGSEKALPLNEEPQLRGTQHKLTTAERFADKSRANAYDNERNHFDGNRSAPTEQRFDGRDRQTSRFSSGGGRNNERSYDNRYDRKQNDGRFDSRNRGNNSTNDRDQSINNDRSANDRSLNERSYPRNNHTTPNSGYKTGTNSIEFKNQVRNVKSGDGPSHPANSLLPNVNKAFNNSSSFGSGRTQSFEYEENARHDSNNFQNNKLERVKVPADEFDAHAERAPGDRAITGRHGIPVANKLLHNMHHTVPLPLINNSLLGNAPHNILQQQSSSDTSHNPNNNEVSRPKRYSALRQRSTTETAQQLPSHVQNNSMSIHDQQQLMIQRQQQQQHHLQEQIQHSSNHAPASTYIQQPLQNNSLPTQQQILLAAQQQQQSNPVVAPNVQYQAAYYSNQTPSQQNEYTGPPTVAPTQQQSSSYQPQYGVSAPSNASYISTAPAQQAAFLAQQQPQQAQAPVSQKQPGAAVNYCANQPQQQPFTPGPTFPNYPPVANYNSVSSGITYYAPQTQPPPRPILPQRRPTNAIPILAPPERSGVKTRGDQRNNTLVDENDDDVSNKLAGVTIGSPENIDHILDNMFVQRAPYQPPAANPIAAAPKEDGSQASDASAENVSDMKSAELKKITPIENTLLKNLNEHVLSSMTAGVVVESAMESAATAQSS